MADPWLLPALIWSACASIGVPLLLFFWWRRRTHAALLPFLVGALTFILFALVLESLCHRLVLGSTALTLHPTLYVLYGGLAAGLFEESGRWLAFRLALPKRRQPETAISYGIGHGGIESILLVGFNAVTMIILLVMAGGAASSASWSTEGTAAGMSALTQAAPDATLFGGFERIVAIALPIALSVFVFYAVRERKGVFWLLAVGVHMAVDCYAMLYQVGALSNLLLIELGVLAMTAVAVWGASRLYRRCRDAAADGVENRPTLADPSEKEVDKP